MMIDPQSNNHYNNHKIREDMIIIPNLDVIFRDGNNHKKHKKIEQSCGTWGSCGIFKIELEMDETLTYIMPCNIYYDEIIEYSNGTSNIPKCNNSKIIKIPK